MGDYLFNFTLGKYEFGIMKHFNTIYFNNGYMKSFLWFYIYSD